MFLDGRVVLYRWGPHNTTTETATVALEAGRSYDLRVEMFDETGAAMARRSWEHACQPREIVPTTQLSPLLPSPPVCVTAIPGGAGVGLRGQYFGDTGLQGQALQRVDPRVEFAWGVDAPAPGVDRNGFSVRWTGQLESPITGPLTLYFLADDVGRAWVDGLVVMDSWADPHAAQEMAVTLDAVAGRRYDVRLEMKEEGDVAAAWLRWSWPCHEREVVPAGRLYPAAAI